MRQGEERLIRLCGRVKQGKQGIDYYEEALYGRGGRDLARMKGTEAQGHGRGRGRGG